MIGRKGLLAVQGSVLLLGSMPQGSDAQSAAGAASGREPWSLEVRVPLTEVAAGGELLVWLGARNEGEAPGVVCPSEYSFSLKDPSNRSLGGTFGAWVSHTCERDTDWHLVLPGESYFTIASLRVPSDFTDPSTLTIRGSYRLTCPALRDCARKQVTAETATTVRITSRPADPED